MNTFSQSIRVALADDHALIRAGVRMLLDSIPGIEVVAEAGDGAELLRSLAVTTVDVVLMDLTMPGVDGVTAIDELRRSHPRVRVLVLSMHESIDVIRRAVAAGACGYVTKLASDLELEQAVRTVKATGSYFSPSISLRLLQAAQREKAEALTGRQREILTLLAEGKAAKEIGFMLGLSSRTIDVHRARITKRLQLNGTANLTRYAMRAGLVSA